MSQQSNGYVVRFSVIMTLIVGGLLAGVSVLLKDKQKESEEIDRQKQILASVMDISSVEDINALYTSRIQSFVIDIKGNRIDTLDAAKVDVRKEYKNVKDPSGRVYPVFTFMKEDGNTVDAYILPVYGNGLWDNIWGFVAVDTDLNTIRGVTFGHAGETPGLGARITSPEVQDRFAGRKIFDPAGDLMAVTMLKGEGNPASALDDHHVNGMSGATITGNGVSAMLKSYMGHYSAFLKSSGQAAAAENTEDQLAVAN